MLKVCTCHNVNRRSAIKTLAKLPVSGLVLASALSLQGCGENGIVGDWVATDYKKYEYSSSLPNAPTMTVSADGSFLIKFTRDFTWRGSWVAFSDDCYKLDDKTFALSSSGKFLSCEEDSLEAVARLGGICAYGAYISGFQRK